MCVTPAGREQQPHGTHPPVGGAHARAARPTWLSSLTEKPAGPPNFAGNTDSECANKHTDRRVLRNYVRSTVAGHGGGSGPPGASQWRCVPR
eukprot:3234731-Prymnesium_polylepis.1